MSPTFHLIQKGVIQFGGATKGLHSLGALLVLLILANGCRKVPTQTITPSPRHS